MSKKIGHSNSLRRKCFAKLDLSQSDPCGTPARVDQSAQTPANDCIPAMITVEDVDSKQSSKPKRKHGSLTPSAMPSPLHGKPRFSMLNHSTSGSSIDSGIGLSRSSSSNSLLYGSKRPSRESSTASPLLDSQQPFSGTNYERLSTDGHNWNPCTLSSDGFTKTTGRPATRILNSHQSESILNDSGIDDGIDDLSQRTQRLSISKGAVDDLQAAVQRLLEDLEERSQTEQIQIQGYLGASNTESDAPWVTNRRHSSGYPCTHLTRHQNRVGERKRSAQLFFPRDCSMEKSCRSSSGFKRRRSSACIACGRPGQREPTSMSTQSVIIKTTRSPDQQKWRRFSEVLKVCKRSEIPYTEVQLTRFEELTTKERATPRNQLCNSQELPHKQIQPFPHNLFSKHSQDIKPAPDVTQDEQLQFILETNMPKFLKYTDWNVLFSHLVSKQLLSSECKEILLNPLKTDTDKGNYFYGQFLSKMGRESEAYIRLCECLKATESEQLGHGTLLNIISEGFCTYFYDKYCQIPVTRNSEYSRKSE